jgi:hypothetical protein
MLSRLAVSQSELRRLKSQGVLDTRPLVEWTKDVHRIVQGWYGSKSRAYIKLAEFDELVEQIKNAPPSSGGDGGGGDTNQDEDDDFLQSLPEQRELLVAECDYWVQFLLPLGADLEACSFRVAQDDNVPGTYALKPTFEQLSFDQRVCIMDRLCQWNISTERKAMFDALRAFPDGIPAMRARILGHDDFGALYLYNPEIAPLRIFRENQTELIASRTTKHDFDIAHQVAKNKRLGKRELKKLARLAELEEKQKQKKYKKPGRKKRDANGQVIEEPGEYVPKAKRPPSPEKFEILRSSGRARRPREVVHLGADTFFGKNKAKLVVMEEEEEDDEDEAEEDEDELPLRGKLRARRGEKQPTPLTQKELRAFDQLSRMVRNPLGAPAFSFETLTGDVLGMDRLIAELTANKCCSRALLENLQEVKDEAMEYYQDQEQVVLEMDTAQDKAAAESTIRKRSSRLAVLEEQRMVEEDEKRLRRMEDDEARRAENARRSSLRARPPPVSKRTRFIPARACRDDAASDFNDVVNGGDEVLDEEGWEKYDVAEMSGNNGAEGPAQDEAVPTTITSSTSYYGKQRLTMAEMFASEWMCATCGQANQAGALNCEKCGEDRAPR